jgi:hypothetical protein
MWPVAEFIRRQSENASVRFIFRVNMQHQSLTVKKRQRVMELYRQQMLQELPKSKFPKVRTLRLTNFSLRPLHMQMTCYLFLFHPHLSGRSYRLKIEFSAERWHVSFERPKQSELLNLVKRRHSAKSSLNFVPSVNVPTVSPIRRKPEPQRVNELEPEIEIIPLAPVWRQAA